MLINRHLYGLHDPAPKHVLPHGWLVIPVEVGHSSDPHPGIDFGAITGPDRAAICRIQHAWGEGGGCISPPEHLLAFVRRVESLVASSRDCSIWIIGNEPNLLIEWPNGIPITPAYYSECYDLCHALIHDLSGHETDEVLLAPTAPWNIESGMGWIEYFQATINACLEVDGFALHTYSRGPDPASITSEAKMDAPWQAYYNGFRTYRDWIAAIPERYTDRPLYITETNQIDPWLDVNNGWVQEAYREIDEWNKSGRQIIRCLTLYRWPDLPGDQWGLDGKDNVIDDLHDAMALGYTWTDDGNGGNGMPIELQNGDFEAGFYHYQGIGELQVGNGWEPWWTEDGGRHRPEYKPEQQGVGSSRVYEGQYAQKMFTTYSPHFAGLRQIIDLQSSIDAGEIAVGDWLRFSGMVWVWSSDENDPEHSTKPGLYHVAVGVNAWGDTAPRSFQTNWGRAWVDQYDQWLHVAIVFQVWSSKVCLFTLGYPVHPVHHNDSYWDALKLEIHHHDEAPEPPEPPIEPLPGECAALTYQETVDAVQEAVRGVWAEGVCIKSVTL